MASSSFYSDPPFSSASSFQGSQPSLDPRSGSIYYALFPAGNSPPTIIRAHLTEIQAAEVGRKSGSVDRRPLDPPPVVQLHLSLVTHPGTLIETETEILNPEDVDYSGFICEAALFRSVPIQMSASDSTFDPHSISTNGNPVHRSIHSSYPTPEPVSENSIPSNCTTDLCGTTFVQATIIEHQGTKSLMFAFTDLSSRRVGDFFLGYKFFNIHAQSDGVPSRSVQANCFGRSFHVYSSKDVPSLSPSTDLTKSLAKGGIWVTPRQRTRKRRTESESIDEDGSGVDATE
ncbi:velvet factor-domain-containing protein [Mycena crocata]|nr:velvet factor-domain-containing protein [Mycena crocata]